MVPRSPGPLSISHENILFYVFMECGQGCGFFSEHRKDMGTLVLAEQSFSCPASKGINQSSQKCDIYV